MKPVFHVVSIIAITVYVAFSLEPDWAKVLVIDGQRMSETSVPYSMMIRFDKLAMALVILLLFGFGYEPFNFKKVLKFGSLSAICAVSLLIGVALSLSYVTWDPKLPPETWLFILNNLFIVCIAEEAIFRRYVQSQLQSFFTRFRYAKASSLLGASLIFGLAHSPGGLTFVALATIAGLFYGWAYQKTGRIEASVICHFALNLVHFLLFSYPALDHHL